MFAARCGNRIRGPSVITGVKASFLRALLAFLYILAIASVPQYLPEPGEEIAPILGIGIVLSLFVLSVAVMAYLFFWQPVQLLLAGAKKEAADSFFHTLGFFALLLLVLGVIVAIIAW